MSKTHLEITDMPTDNLQALGKLRTVLVGTFNKAREHKHRMALLKVVLKFMYNKCAEFEKSQETPDPVRIDILKQATKLNIDLDERLSTEKLAIELADKIKELNIELNTEQKESK